MKLKKPIRRNYEFLSGPKAVRISNFGPLRESMRIHRGPVRSGIPGILNNRNDYPSESLSPAHTSPEEFENGGFTLKTHQMFSLHTAPENFENATITGHFGFAFENHSGRKITWLSRGHRCQKAPFS